ncbi:MAG: FHA domain-containing protein [Clostridia bacterium]|nr:FHA domain-containing protein [Clostridia bacterium]
MEKYKICPSCGTRNAPTVLECTKCEADLTRVKITDEENERLAKEAAAAEKTAGPVMVRVCDCGERNPANARKCHACGEDISDIPPSTEEVSAPTGGRDFVLGSLDGQYAYRLPAADVTVGRENEMRDYLSSKRYVSRTHARLIIEGDALFIENLSTTNFTYINDQRIAERTELHDGDELGLGGMNIGGKRQSDAAYFLVRICACT